jgi:hypothetical protein
MSVEALQTSLREAGVSEDVLNILKGEPCAVL